MHFNNLVFRFASIACLALATWGASAQSGITSRAHCHAIGTSPREPLGDREGHALSISQIACRIEGGPADGGVMTFLTTYEWNQSRGVVLNGAGVTRTAGGTLVAQTTEGAIALVTTDGKVTGIMGSGRGRYTLATGTAAALAGTSYQYTFRSIAPGQVVIDIKSD